MKISFCIRKNSDLHLRKMQINFYVRKNSDLHLRKMQFSFCVGKNLGLHLRLHLFWLQRIFGNAFTPACVFGRYWKFGQTELVFRIDCKIRHFRHKTNSSFVLPSNELHLSHSLEASHTHSSQTQGWYSPSSVQSRSILSLAPNAADPLLHASLNSTHSPTS